MKFKMVSTVHTDDNVWKICIKGDQPENPPIIEVSDKNLGNAILISEIITGALRDI